MSELYPFSAIVGMDLAKTSLLLHAVNPRLGGVLMSGHRGCAKTTLARAFANLLSERASCELPLGASEDRLLGSVDVAAVLERNEWSHQPGLLEQANGGLLYVDEVNLLPDALSDQLLDAAATGYYQLEREGMSRRIESRFILIGTMNPEEGELRPQLADRFAHSVTIETDLSVADRSRIIGQGLSFESDADSFCQQFEQAELALCDRIAEAKSILTEIVLPQELLDLISEKAESLSLEGMRGGLAVAKTALAAAAWDGRKVVKTLDLNLAWQLCLGHRQESSNDPPKPPESSESGGEKSQGKRSFVSLQPRGANEDAITQTAGSGVEAAGIEEMKVMENFLQASLTLPQFASVTRRSTISNRSGLIHWKDSVLGWVRDARREHLRRLSNRKNRQLWIFLDASRSTGANGFLEKSLTLINQSMNALGFHSTRIHVLQLSQGEISWLGQNMVPGATRRAMKQAFTAAGESCLGEAFMELLRDTRRREGGETDSVLLISDGICSVSNQQSFDSIQAVMKRNLVRISRMGPKILWCAPRPMRGFLHPVDTLGIRPVCEALSI